jgi:hypothetical protein
MNRLRLSVVYEWGLLAVLLLIVVHAPISVGFGHLLPQYTDVIKAWKEIVLGLLSIVAIILITRHKLWHTVLRNKLMLLSLLFIDIHLLLAALLFKDPAMTVAGLFIDLRFIVMFMLMYVLILIRPLAMARIIKVAAIGAMIVVGFGLLQITVLPDNALKYVGYSKTAITPYTTIDRNPDFVRINSTVRGPNPLGALIVIYIALLSAYAVRQGKVLPKKRVLWVAGIIGSVAVLFATFSRSAYAAAILAPLAVIISTRRITKRAMIIAAACLVVSATVLMLASSSSSFSNIILHENPNSTVTSKSNAEHVTSLKTGLSHLINQPFGGGIGSTGSASLYDKSSSNDIIIENAYFFIAHESGIIGLLIFVTLFVMTLRSLYRRRSNWIALGLFGSGIGLALIGLLLPVWTDDTVAIIWWGLAGALIATPRAIIKGKHDARTRQQKTTRAA